MKLNVLITTLVVVLSMQVTAQESAEPAEDAGDSAAIEAMTKGYGDFTWGQDREEILAALGDEVQADESRISVKGKAPRVQTMYRFYHDQLGAVVVYFKLPGKPSTGVDKEALNMISEALTKKYGLKNRETRSALERAGININVQPSGPQIVVSYSNLKAIKEAQAAALAKERESTTTADKQARQDAIDSITGEL